MKPMTAVAVLLIDLICYSVLPAQQPFEVPLTVTDGENTDTLYFGILPTANFCIVQTDGFNGHFEYFLPPGPPVSGVFYAFFRWPHAGSNQACFDQGSLNDFRPFMQTAQRDTFRVWAVRGSGTTMVFSWPAGLSAYFTQLTLRYFDGSGNVNIDMLADTSVNVTDAGDPAIANIYSGGLRPTSVEEVGLNIPRNFVLNQNYPNPFNPTTNLRFQIADFGFVSLKVFDVLGREVATLVDGPREPGEHSVEWNPEGLSSGIYMYRLATASATLTRKMLLLR